MDLGKLSEMSEHRICKECGAEFRTIRVANEPELSALMQFADHSTIHQPTLGQWTVAHNLIQAAKRST